VNIKRKCKNVNLNNSDVNDLDFCALTSVECCDEHAGCPEVSLQQSPEDCYGRPFGAISD